jgi:2-polyprenyl-6-methoxyphenol hydroxylase-like FAD-dependent oxidoreductase
MYDVIVVGARCAGSAIAAHLAGAGHRVLLLDRDTFPSDMTHSTHLVHQRGVACLGRLGVREELVATGAPPIERLTFDLGPMQLAATAPPFDGERFAFSPRRILLDHILVRAATRAGAELREGCRVLGVISGGDRITGVRAASPGGGQFTEMARWIIGADGPSSTVATSVGAVEYAQKPALMGTAWAYWDGVAVDQVEVRLREGEAVYSFPTSGGTLVGVNLAMDRFRAARRDAEASYLDVLARQAPELRERISGARRADERLYLGSTRNFFRKARGPGWVLLGDAHYKKDPCTAQGITDALVDAELLAASLGRVLRGEVAAELELAAYEKECVERAMPFYELTTQMAPLDPPPPELAALQIALRDSPEDVPGFIGMITEATSPAEYLAPANVTRILARAEAAG